MEEKNCEMCDKLFEGGVDDELCDECFIHDDLEKKDLKFLNYTSPSFRDDN